MHEEFLNEKERASVEKSREAIELHSKIVNAERANIRRLSERARHRKARLERQA